MEDYDGRQVVGMDLHRRRSVLVRMTEDGRRLGMARITNSPQALPAQVAWAGTSPKVVLEATYGWYWAADTLAAAGAEVHLAHPLGVKAFSYRRARNDERDAADLADLLRMGRLPDMGRTLSANRTPPRPPAPVPRRQIVGLPARSPQGRLRRRHGGPAPPGP